MWSPGQVSGGDDEFRPAHGAVSDLSPDSPSLSGRQPTDRLSAGSGAGPTGGPGQVTDRASSLP